MTKPWRLIGVFAICAVLLIPLGAVADDIVPQTYSTSIMVGHSASVSKTVTITEAPPTSALVDVFFLSDTTGSMGGTINTVKSNVTTIVNDTSGLGDVAYGVGEYRDSGDAFCYRLDQAMTTNVTQVQNGVNMWTASGGGDYAEAGLGALQQASVAASGWRTNSTRILMWFGDAPSHDPSCPGGVTQAVAIAALNAQNIVVEAVNVGYGGLNDYGQATAVTNATGGALYNSPSSDTLVDIITNAIESVFETYSTVALDLSGVPTGLTAMVNPTGYTGSYERDMDRDFGFELTFTGDAVGHYEFDIPVLVDGGQVAIEHDIIDVTAIPVPPSLILLGTGLLGLIPLRKIKLI